MPGHTARSGRWHRREKLHALILGRRNIGEADRLLILFTRRLGIIKAVAKGVRRIPSRRGGYLEPLTHVFLILSGNVARPYIAAVDAIDTFQPLHDEPEVLRHANNIARSIVALCTEHDEQAELFDALCHAFKVLPTLPATKRHHLESALVLYVLQQAGLSPNLTSCLGCARRAPDTAVVLDARQGGWRCLMCHTTFADTRTSLTPRVLKLARWLQIYPQRALNVHTSVIEGQQLSEALHRYVENVIAHVTPVTTSRGYVD